MSQSAIIWPKKYLPGPLSVQIWPLLSNISRWETYYDNCEKITPPSSGPDLQKGDDFKFSTFGFPVLDCKVEESVAPGDGKAGRIAWSAGLGGEEDEAVDVYHAWLVEDLEGGRVRILTQESQSGKPAAQLAGVKPNKMLLGHQDWLEGLVKAARGEKFDKKESNLKSIS